MAKDKRVFTGGMDKDSDPRLIKQGDYRHAENIRNIASSDGTSGSVENIESTVKVPYSFKGEDVDKIIVVDEGKASVLPQRSVFYSQTITFEFMSYVEEWSGKERNSFTMYSYTPERELEQIGHRWSANGSLRWSEHSFKPTAEHIFDLFNEESGTISKNIPIINLNTGEWETAHSKVNIPVRSFLLGGGRKISIEIIADKKGVPFLLDFSSPGSDRYWTQSIEDYPPYGRINLTGGPNSVIYSPLVLSSQSSFYSEDTNTQVLDEFVDVDGNSFDNDVPTPIEGDTITEYTLSFEGEEPTSPQDANEIQIFSYTENSLGDFEVAPFLSFGDGLYNSGQTYEFDTNQSSLSNSLHDAFEKFEGKVLHKGETAIDGSLDSTKGQVSLGFSKGESLKGNNFSEVQDSANASESDFGLFKGFYNSDSLGGYASQPSIEILNGDITLTESSLANNNSWKFPLKLSKNNAYLVQADISDFNASSAVLDVKIPSSSRSLNSKDLKASDSDLSIDGVNNNFEWIIPASDLEADSRSLEIDFISGAIEEDESVTIKNLRVSKLKKSSFKLDVSLRSLTDFNLCFGSSEEQVLASLREGADLSKQEEFVDGSIFAKLSLERKQGKDLGYVSDQLIEAQEKIEELNNVIATLNTDLKNLKTSYNETLKDINDILPLDGNVTFTLFNELENKSSTLATTITDVSTKVDDLVSKVTVFQTLEQLQEIATLEQSIVDLRAEIDALNLASEAAAAQALIKIENAFNNGAASITPEDGVNQSDVDAVQALLDIANDSISGLQNTIDNFNHEDGVTQVDVDAVQALLDQANDDLADLNIKVSTLTDSEAAVTAELSTKSAEVIRIQASLDTALANQEDGITQTDVDNAVAPIKALLTQAQTEINAVDPNDGLADTVVDSFQDLITTALATLTTQKEELTGVFDNTQTSSDIAAINDSISTLQTEIVRLQGVERDQITQSDVTTAVTNLKDILVNASTVDLANLTSTDAATQVLLDAISKEVTDASTIITDAITKINQQKQDAVDYAVSGLYTLVQLNEEYIKGYVKGTTLIKPEGGASQADTDGEINAAIYAAEQLIASGKSTSFTEGVNSVTPEDGINQSHVDAAYQSGLADGAAGVDITTDNQASFDAGVTIVKNNPNAYNLYSKADYEANFTLGVDSVDLSILGNPEIAKIAGEQYAAGVTATQELFNNDLTQLTLEQAQNAGLAWAKGIRDGFFGEGVTSVDITSDNQAVADTAFASGAASVDITSDNQAVADAAYAEGEAAGVASVDITSDNEAVRSSAYAAGVASVTPEDGVNQSDVDAVQKKLDSLTSLIGALPTSYTDSDSITTAVNNIETSLNTVVDTKSSLITSLVNAFNAGEASVDITTDNQGVINTAVGEINTALTNAKTDLKILESDLTVITQGTKDALESLLDEANRKITAAENATDLVQEDLDAIEASLLAADLLLDATVVKTDSETGEIINNTQASLDAVIGELADLKYYLFGFDSEKYANVQAQVNAAVAAAENDMSAAVAAAIAAAVSIQQPTTGITIPNVNAAIDAAISTIVPDDGITQAEVDAAYAAGAASITPEDGVSQADLDAVQAELDSIIPEDGITQEDLDDLNEKIGQLELTVDEKILEVANIQAELDAIVPEDGITQADVDAVQALLDSIIPEDGINQGNVDAAVAGAIEDYKGQGFVFTQADINNAIREGAASVTPEDGVTQDDVDAVQNSLKTAISTLRAALNLSADAEADATANISALTTKITQLNAAQAELTALNASAVATGGATIGDAAALIADYNTLKNSKIELQAQINDVTTLLESATGTFENLDGTSAKTSALLPDTIQPAIQNLKNAQSTLDGLIETTGSSIDSISSTVTTLYNNAQLLKEAKTYAANLAAGMKFSDDTTSLYNAFDSETDIYGIQVKGEIGAISEEIFGSVNEEGVRPISGSTSTDLFYLIKFLRDTYNILYDNYSDLYSAYTILEGEQDNLVQKSQLEAAEAAQKSAEDAASLANQSLELLNGGQTVENYIGNGSFDRGTDVGWTGLYSEDQATNYWIIENEKLVRSAYSTGSSIGGVSYAGSDATNDKRIQVGNYIVSVSLKSLDQGDQHDNDGVFLNIGDNYGNTYLSSFEVKGKGFTTGVFSVESVEENTFFNITVSFNGSPNLDFNLGVDDIQIIKIPEVNYDQNTLNALVTKMLIQQSITDHENRITAMEEQYAIDLEAAEAFSYSEGAASVTPEDGVTQADVDEVQALLDDALANQEDGITQADVNAATAAGNASLKENLQRIALSFKNVFNAKTLNLDSLVASDSNDWANIQTLSIEELKDYIFTEINNSVDLSGYTDGELMSVPEINNLVFNYNSVLQDEITELNFEKSTITANFESDISKFVSLFSKSLASIETENNNAITEYVETLSFASDYAGSTDIHVDAEFKANTFKSPVNSVTAGNSSFLVDNAAGWEEGDILYDEQLEIIGVIASISSNTISLSSPLSRVLGASEVIQANRLDQLLLDSPSVIEETLNKGDIIFVSKSGENKEVGEIKEIEDGPEVLSKPNQRLVTFKENISISISENSVILYNKLLNNLRDEFNVRSSSIDEFLQDLLEQVSNLSNLDGSMGSLIEAYRFTLFGTPLKEIDSLNNLGELKLLMRNPDVVGYEDWNPDNYVVKIIDANNIDYSETNAVSSILENHENFTEGEDTAFGGGNLTEAENIASSSHFHYKIIPSNSDSLANILKLRFEFGSGDITPITQDETGQGMPISHLDIVDINGDDITNGYSFVLSIVRGSSANKWEFALSNSVDSNVLNSQIVQWEILEEEFDTTTLQLDPKPLVDDSNSNLNTLTNESDSDWEVNTYNSSGWAWNSNGYYEGINGGVVSGVNGGGFNQSNSLSLPLVDSDGNTQLEPNTTYTISFIEPTVFEDFREVSVSWAVPNTTDLQDIAYWEQNTTSTPGYYSELGAHVDTDFGLNNTYEGTYWSCEEVNPDQSYGTDTDKVRVGVFSYDQFAGRSISFEERPKNEFHRLRLITVIENAPASATVDEYYAGGVVIKRSGSTVKVVALSDSTHDVVDTLTFNGKTYGLPHYENEPNKYIELIPEDLGLIQFVTDFWYWAEYQFLVDENEPSNRNNFADLAFAYSEFSALDDQKLRNESLDVDGLSKVNFRYPVYNISNYYTSSATSNVGVLALNDLQIGLNNGDNIGARENNVQAGFPGSKESLRATALPNNSIQGFSAAVKGFSRAYTSGIFNYFLSLNNTSANTTLTLVTGPDYDSSITGAGKIVVQPGPEGFKGRFYGLQVTKFKSQEQVVQSSRRVLSLLGEKIQEADTHNVINQSPVYGTALSNAYNSNKTLIRNNNTGNVDVTPLIEGGYVCVGAYEDKPKNKIYYFVSEESKDKKRDSILEYDLMNDKITTVYQDDVGSSSGDSNVILNFSESHLITGINKVDDILYFTDNLNRPRKINVELAKKNEENISNPPYVFQDTFFNTFESTVFIGGNNDHALKDGDYVYTQYDSTTDKNSCFNGYAEVLGVAPKLNQGVTIAINKGDTSATLSSTDHGLSSSNVGEFLAIIDGTLPHYYKIVSVSGATIGLENPYNESNKTEAKSLNIDGLNVSGIITDCPFGNSVSSSQGKILYANPKDAYSPLITFGEYESKMKYFDVIKHQPTHRPSIEMRKDSNVATNNIIDNVFQFKYRYNHFDEENTAYSSISDVAIDGSYAINAPVNASDFDLVKNMIEVYYDDAISDVEFIEVVARKGNDGKFFLIESVPNNFINYLKSVKNSLILDSEDEYVIEKSSIKFYNNGVYPFVDELDSDKLFDSVPIKAKAQTIMSNNRLAYGNIVEGYDNTDLVVKTSFNSEEAPVLETETSDILFDPSIPSGYTENENGYDNKQGGGRPTFNPTVDFNNINLSSDKSQFIELDFNSVFEYKKGSGTIYRSSNFYGAWRVTGITTAQELADFIVNRIENGDFVGGTGTGEATDNTNKASVSASSNASGKVTIRFEWSKKNSARMSSIHSTNLRFKSQTVAGKLTSGTVGVGAFKSGAFHNFGIAYFDETNRCSFVNTAPSYANVNVSGGDVKNLNGTRAYNPFYTESGGPKLGQGSSVSLEIYNQAPDWAKYFQIYYTGNNTVDEFVQMTVTGAEHGQSTGDDQMYLSLNSLKGKDYSYNQTNNSQLDYNFVPGDRIRFISCVKGGSRVKFNEYIDLEIAGEDLFQGTDNPIGDKEGYYIRINDPKNDAVKIISDTSDTTGTVDISTQGSRDSVADSGYDELIVEIYRPKKNTEEDFMVYYEVGDKYPIFNGYHSGDSSQGGEFRFDGVPNIKISETPAVININSGDVYLKPRTMFTSGDDSGTDATTFFPEDYNLNDFHNTNHYSKGRINVINVNSRARRLDASVYYSEPYSSTGSINGLSSFNLATQPYFDYNKGFGSIQSLQTKDDDLIIFHENKVGRVLVEKDILNTASGDGLVSLSRDIIKNYITVYSGEYGCCLQPESIVKYNDKFYFVDIKRGAVLRLSNDGITAISDYGMRDYFRDIGEMYVEYDPETQDNQVFNIVAGFDPKYNEYIVTLPAVYDKTEGLWDSDVKTWNSKSDRFSVVSPQKIFFAKTVAFNEDIDRWTSFYNFYPEFYSRVNNQFVGFQAGYMFKHNMTDRYYQDLYLNSPVASKSSPNYNVCYDNVLDSMIEFPFNAEPDSVKNYNAISLNSDTKLFTNMKTNIGQTGVGEDNYSGYNNVISTGIGFRKVKGEVISVNGKYLVGNSNSSNGDICKFYEDLHKGDIIKIIGKRKSEDAVSFATYAIVNAISSNTLITLNKEVELNVVSHLEVIDYRTKEGMQYAQIPFVSSMGYESESLGFNGDGSELSFVGVMNSIPFDYAEGSVFASVNIVPRVTYSVNEIAPDKMITGAMYILSSISNNDNFNINNVSNTSATGYTNTVGEAFICSSRSSSTSSRVIPVTERAFVQDLNTNEVIFIGYPFGFVQESGSNFNKIKVSLSEEGKAFIASNPSGASRYALFLAKDGNIEGERLKGSYMMATLTTKSPSSTSKSDLPKYKFNLYSASVDVDKSELSGQ